MINMNILKVIYIMPAGSFLHLLVLKDYTFLGEERLLCWCEPGKKLNRNGAE